MSLAAHQARGRQAPAITVTRHGKPIAELRAPAVEKPSLYGSMRGTVVFAPDYDPAEPAFDGEWDAQKGIRPDQRLLY